MIDIIGLADAAVASLNAAFVGTFTAVRGYKPRYKLAEMSEYRVTIAPAVQESAHVSRNHYQNDYTLDIAVQKQADTDAARDTVMGVAMNVQKHFMDNRRMTVSGKVCSAIAFRRLPYSPEHVDEHQVLTSVISVTFREINP